MKVTCENAATCGVLSQATKVGKKDVITYSCAHAVEHDFTDNCKNTSCKRCWPAKSACVEPVIVPTVVVVDEAAMVKAQEIAEASAIVAEQDAAEVAEQEVAAEMAEEATLEVAMDEATDEVIADERAADEANTTQVLAELAESGDLEAKDE